MLGCKSVNVGWSLHWSDHDRGVHASIVYGLKDIVYISLFHSA